MKHFITSQGYLSQIQERAAGIGMSNVSAAKLATITIPIAPLSERRKIVAKIDSLSSKSKRVRDHLDIVPRLLEKYKQAIMVAAFQGELTREWRESRSPEAVTFGRRNIDQRVNQLGELPTTWRWTAMQDVASISGGLTKNGRRAELPNPSYSSEGA
ncbi:hypothetical protein HAP41_0000045325 [Bradyrhizobium barranii subsp. apii]|uniref:Type I restriction modification DNA specificity domain-containing protein n=1 Tax=Bradyrhizobium barranii subsp. apii TaxID=2819348 RepID=A0A8U0FHR2_9BRAD|nr:hypothetical protein [Bradyrhizobium barranii]UPT87276.1 hypothetical protein HAP41_0000045325 [Bradyrhizobium barranii subsp. apii]